MTATVSPPRPASPPARRPTAAAWRDPRLVVGVVLVAVSVLLGARLLAAADDTVGVWVASRDLAAGTTVGAADLVRGEVRFAAGEDADRYLPAAVPLPAGTVLARDVGAGELLARAALAGPGSATLLEVPVPVPAGLLPATVRRGAVVDVWVIPSDVSGVADPQAALVFHDVRVLQLPAARSALGPETSRQVIVGVGPGDEPALARALAQVASGTVVVTRRG